MKEKSWKNVQHVVVGLGKFILLVIEGSELELECS